MQTEKLNGSILLTGGNGVVGNPLSQKLIADGVSFTAVSRAPSKDQLQWDMTREPEWQVLKQLKSTNTDTVIHCAPIWLLPNHLLALATMGVRRIVVFSSSSVSGKQHSSDVSEQKLVQQLLDSEQKVEKFSSAHNIDLTIFRPSMIYGYARDQNVSHIAKFIQQYGFMFLVGKASGLRQPVHADDLVESCLAVLDNPACVGKTYNLAGQESITYRAMVERIFAHLNKKARIVSLPLPLFRLGLRIAKAFGTFSYTPEMADRMNQNLNYDISPAQRDFGYSPQSFLSQSNRDLP